MKSKIIFTLICFIGFLACTNNDENGLEREALNFKFDRTLYEQYGSTLITLMKKGRFAENTSKSSSLETQARGILDNINSEFGTNVAFTQADADFVNSKSVEEMKRVFLDKKYVSNQQFELIDRFATEAEQFGFETAITNFEESILNMKGLTEEEFNKYNYVVNTLYIANDYFTENDLNGLIKKPSWWQAAGCGVAIAANAVATYGLVACAVPNPTTPAACGVAIAGKALAYAGIVFGCF